ncbi:MAG TPA: hypothetical protein DEP35_12310 [Deltaproteobacteria bacterium]|jgi:hypothetical protein|nr:hypothetical protein [Deltaproteobacteria bacterium]
MTICLPSWQPVPEPTPCASFRKAWAALGRRPLGLLTTQLVLLCVWGLSALLLTGPGGVIGAAAFAAFVAAPLQDGFAYVCLRAVRGAPAPAHLGLRVLDNYRESVAAGVLVFLLTLLGLALFLLPGILFYCRTRFVPYLIVEEGLDAADAIQESFRLTRGHGLAILGMSASGAVACAAGLLCLGGGVIPALTLWELARASLYHAVVLPSEAWDPSSRLARPMLSA